MNGKTRCALGMFLAASFIFAFRTLAVEAGPKIAQVYFAQTHVLAPDNPLFKLVGNREALIKVQVYSENGARAPIVVAQLALNSKVLEIPLSGPAILPKPPTEDPQLLKHTFADSFTGMIPKEWIKPGLKVAVEMRNSDSPKKTDSKGASIGNRVVLDSLAIGAPTHLTMWMFDVHYFAEQKEDYPNGWLEEIYQKLPVAELELRRIPKIVFEKLAMPPRGGKPAVVSSSRADYKEKTGFAYDGEQDIAKRWNGAIKHAARAEGQLELYYLNIYGVPAGGEGGMGVLSGVGNGKQPGILIHELGHVFGLPHWGLAKRYPYRGPMFGIQTESADTVHVGPTWAFDLSKNVFIPPTVQSDKAKGAAGHFKRDPMWGGGTGDQESPFIFRHFSDYSVQQIRNCLESKIVWDAASGNYMTWNQAAGTYSNPVKHSVDKFPVEREVDVISVLASASGPTPDANIVYPPIGPYKTGLAEIYDAASSKDITRAREFGYSEVNCNVCFRVTQGGATKSYLLRVKIDRTEDPLNVESFKTFAINLPAKNGEVTQVDMLHTPDVMKNGLTPEAKVLYSWKKSAQSPEKPASTITILKGKEATVTKTTASVAPAKLSETTKADPVPKPTAVPEFSVPDDVRSEWLGKLIQEIVTSAKGGKPLKGMVNLGGNSKVYTLMGADEKKLQVDINGNAMPVNWSWFKPKDYVALAKSLAKDDSAESQLILGVFLFANGEKEAGETAFARAALLDVSASTKAREQLQTKTK